MWISQRSQDRPVSDILELVNGPVKAQGMLSRTIPLFKLLPGLPRRIFSCLTSFLGPMAFLLRLEAHRREESVKVEAAGTFTLQRRDSVQADPAAGTAVRF